MDVLRKSWKTSLFGVISAVGLAMASGTLGDGKTKEIGNIVAAIGTIGTGLAAKDSNVTGGTKQQ